MLLGVVDTALVTPMLFVACTRRCEGMGHTAREELPTRSLKVALRRDSAVVKMDVVPDVSFRTTTVMFAAGSWSVGLRAFTRASSHREMEPTKMPASVAASRTMAGWGVDVDDAVVEPAGPPTLSTLYMHTTAAATVGNSTTSSPTVPSRTLSAAAKSTLPAASSPRPALLPLGLYSTDTPVSRRYRYDARSYSCAGNDAPAPMTVAESEPCTPKGVHRHASTMNPAHMCPIRGSRGVICGRKLGGGCIASLRG